MVTAEENRLALVKGISAFVIWGLFPVYFNLVGVVSPFELAFYRIVFSLPVMVLYIYFRREFTTVLLTLIKIPHKLPQLLLALGKTFYANLAGYRAILPWLIFSSLLISFNWIFFVVAVSIEKVIETSLGYFISPLITIFFSLIFFKESLSRTKKIALSLAGVGVMLKIISYGQFPLIALSLALSFSGYGAVKKHIQHGHNASVLFMIETALLFPFALLALYLIEGEPLFASEYSLLLKLLIVNLGLVTTIPLLLFNQSVQKLNFSRIGFIQYLTPSISFILAVVFYKEPFSFFDFFVFILIWGALFLLGFEAYHHNKKPANNPANNIASL